MPLSSVAESLLPSLIVIAVGYSLARWAGLSTAPVITLLRYVFFPVYLFMTLGERISSETFFYVALIGGAVVGAGVLIHRHAHRVLKTQVDASVAIPNVACFAIPVFALSMGGSGLGTACAFFAGVSIAASLIEKKGAVRLLREPWIYAAIAGIFFFAGIRGSIQPLDVVLSSFVPATYPLLLLVLGASLHPLEGIKDLDAWATAVLRVVGGFLVALVAVSILPVSPAVAAGTVMASMAPPATKSLLLSGSIKETPPSSRGPSNVGLLVSLIVFAFFLLTGWEPW